MDVDDTSDRFDLESVLNKDEGLDDYVAVDKPRYSPKKKQQQRQIIIHEDSSSKGKKVFCILLSLLSFVNLPII
jgi:hypothetical protein